MTRFINDSATQRLQDLEQHIKERYPSFIGFPGSVDFDYEEVYPFLSTY